MSDQFKIKAQLTDELTELRRQVATLKESEKKYRSLFNDALDMIHIVDKNGKIIDANKTELKTLGYSKEEFIGKHLTEIIHPEYLETTKKALKQVFSGKEIRGYETVIITKDGTNIDVEVNAVPEIVDGKVVSAKGILRDVIERKQSEAETVRLAKFPSENPNPVLRISKDGTIAYHNRASVPLLKLWQYQEDQYLSAKWLKPILKALETGKDQRTEAEYGKRVYSLTFTPVLDSEFVNVYGLDITERTQAEETIKNSEERLSILFEFAPDGYYLNDLRGNFIDGNKAAEKITGYKKEELIGKNFLNLKLLRWDQIPKAAESLVKNALGKPTGPDEFTLIRKDGDRVKVEISTYPVEIKNKTVVLGIARDISGRKRAEEAIQKQNEFLNNVLESLTHPFYVINANDYTLELVNSATTELPLPDHITCHELTHHRKTPCDDSNHPCPVAEIKKTKRPIMVEHIHYDKDGNKTYSEVHAYPLFDENGNVTKVIESVLDITERKQAEEQIKKDLKEKQVLLKEIHHRVKNNLQVISSLLGLQAKHIKDKQVLDMFKESKNRIRSMALVHEELYRSGDFANIDFTKYIHELVDRIRQTYIMKPDRIEFKVEGKDITLGINRAIPCGLVMNELVSNALKHAFPPSFKRKGKIEIAVHPTEAGEIELIVKDNGVGIPEELDILNSESLGMQLVIILAEDQLEGRVKLDRKGGTKFTIIFGQ